MIFFGEKNSDSIVTEYLDDTSCQYCGKQKRLSLNYLITYFHILYIPILPKSGRILSHCSNCEKVNDISEFDEDLQVAFERSQIDTSVPLRYFSFTIIIGLITFISTYVNYALGKEQSALIIIGWTIVYLLLFTLFYYIFKRLEKVPLFALFVFLPFGPIICLILVFLIYYSNRRTHDDEQELVVQPLSYITPIGKKNTAFIIPTAIENDRLYVVALISMIGYAINFDKKLIIGYYTSLVDRFPSYLNEIKQGISSFATAFEDNSRTKVKEEVKSNTIELIRISGKTFNRHVRISLLLNTLKVILNDKVELSEQEKIIFKEFIEHIGFTDEIEAKYSWLLTSVNNGCPPTSEW